jgi:hypothetical protein
MGPGSPGEMTDHHPIIDIKDFSFVNVPDRVVPGINDATGLNDYIGWELVIGSMLESVSHMQPPVQIVAVGITKPIIALFYCFNDVSIRHVYASF